MTARASDGTVIAETDVIGGWMVGDDVAVSVAIVNGRTFMRTDMRGYPAGEWESSGRDGYVILHGMQDRGFPTQIRD